MHVCSLALLLRSTRTMTTPRPWCGCRHPSTFPRYRDVGVPLVGNPVGPAPHRAATTLLVASAPTAWSRACPSGPCGYRPKTVPTTGDVLRRIGAGAGSTVPQVTGPGVGRQNSSDLALHEQPRGSRWRAQPDRRVAGPDPPCGGGGWAYVWNRTRCTHARCATLWRSGTI